MAKYFELSVAKQYVEATEYDTDDSLLMQLGESADQSLDSFLIGIVGTQNLPKEGSVIPEDYKDAVNFGVASKYWLIKGNIEKSKEFEIRKEKMRESIQTALTKDADEYMEIIPRL